MVGPVDEFPCPFEEYTTRVLPEWIDLNGHMNNARYLSMVDLALMTIFIRSGFGRLRGADRNQCKRSVLHSLSGWIAGCFG